MKEKSSIIEWGGGISGLLCGNFIIYLYLNYLKEMKINYPPFLKLQKEV